MSEIEAIKSEIQELADKAQVLVSTMPEVSETDKLRKNIQRGKLIAYEHVLSLINQQNVTTTKKGK